MLGINLKKRFPFVGGLTYFLSSTPVLFSVMLFGIPPSDSIWLMLGTLLGVWLIITFFIGAIIGLVVNILKAPLFFAMLGTTYAFYCGIFLGMKWLHPSGTSSPPYPPNSHVFFAYLCITPLAGIISGVLPAVIWVSAAKLFRLVKKVG